MALGTHNGPDCDSGRWKKTEISSFCTAKGITAWSIRWKDIRGAILDEAMKVWLALLIVAVLWRESASQINNIELRFPTAMGPPGVHPIDRTVGST